MLTAYQIENYSEEKTSKYITTRNGVIGDVQTLKKMLQEKGYLNHFREEGRKFRSIPTGRLYTKDDVYIKAIFRFQPENDSSKRVYAVESIIGEKGYYSPDLMNEL